MPGFPAWSYLFLPEDSSAAEPRPAAPTAARIAKILLWTALAVLFGLLLGRSS